MLENFAITTILILGISCCYYAFRVQSMYSQMVEIEKELEKLKGIKND